MLDLKHANYKMLIFVYFIQQDKQVKKQIGSQIKIISEQCIKYFMLIHKQKECHFSFSHFSYHLLQK